MTTLQSRARRAGAIYAVMSVAQMPVLLYLPHFVVAGDAAATAQRIADRAQIYRLMMLGDLAGSILFIVLGWSLYHLFETVDRKQSMLMLLLVLPSATLGIIDVALLSPPIVLHTHAGVLSAFTPPQIDALALGLLQIRGVALQANEALWGLWLVPFAILVIRSGFIPKVFGGLLLVASVGYVAMSATSIALPAYSGVVNRVGMLLILCELPVILWLLIKGARSAVPSAASAPRTPNGGITSPAA